LFVLIQNLPFVFNPVLISIQDNVNPISVLLLQLHHDIASSRNQSASGTIILNQIFMVHEEFAASTQC
jgi:hypothetical protein